MGPLVSAVDALANAIGVLVLTLAFGLFCLWVTFKGIEFWYERQRKNEEWSMYGARKLRRQFIGDAERIVNDYLENQAEEEEQI